jgi:Metallo-peptidase family M12
MKKTTILLLLSFFLGPLSINAQNSAFHHSCGTSIETQEVLFKNMVELRNRYPNVAASRAIAYIPVWFHMVAKTDGTGRTTEANVAEMLCEWNKIYTANALDIQFYIKGFTKINYDALYNGPQSFDGSNRMAATKKADGMNVYLVNNAGTGTEPAGSIILAYYANRQTTTDAEYASDWIVCSNSQVNASNATTIAHESGHFFTLSHTFYGWENGPFVPTSAAPCAPASINFNGRVIPVEKVVRTGTSKNCDVAGDGFCDTPEDYNFGFGATSCSYSSIAKDPQCVSVNPDETNLMGYFLGCLKIFSAEQKAAIRNNYLNHAKRAYLRTGNITPPVNGSYPYACQPCKWCNDTIFQ